MPVDELLLIEVVRWRLLVELGLRSRPGFSADVFLWGRDKGVDDICDDGNAAARGTREEGIIDGYWTWRDWD